MRKQLFYTHGKILLTGEYLVLKGAKALAFPLRYGQQMVVEPTDGNIITWQAMDQDRSWFTVELQTKTLELIHTTDAQRAAGLVMALRTAIGISGNKHLLNSGLHITTQTNFPINWGFGTSSTFLVNLAKWFGCDPFQLAFEVSKGSGYDIACGLVHHPIIFARHDDKVKYKKVSFAKIFLPNIYLVYSGNKQDTAPIVNRFADDANNYADAIAQVNRITEHILTSNNLDVFMQLLQQHEGIIAGVTDQLPVQQSTFTDFEGVIKSLGAWGGDFLLAVTEQPGSYVRSYFIRRNLDTILSFTETVL